MQTEHHERIVEVTDASRFHSTENSRRPLIAQPNTDLNQLLTSAVSSNNTKEVRTGSFGED